MTTLQENPVYSNDFEDGALDMGMFRGDRDVSEMELYDSGDVVGPTVYGMAPNLSSFQSGPVQNGHSIRLANNMELVSADVSCERRCVAFFLRPHLLFGRWLGLQNGDLLGIL